MKKLTFLLGLAICACTTTQTWTSEEKSLIDAPDSLMRVLTIDNAADSLVLRMQSRDFSAQMLRSEELQRLGDKMLATVQSPEQDGVGIAGPQVGVSRRIVAVLRVDKEGEPFEVYPNIRITACRGELVEGREGCLSVPGKYGTVPRYRDIDIIYSSPRSRRDTLERVQGFAAVIFQHECDHLDGIVYTDRIR